MVNNNKKVQKGNTPALISTQTLLSQQLSRTLAAKHHHVLPQASSTVTWSDVICKDLHPSTHSSSNLQCQALKIKSLLTSIPKQKGTNW